MKLNRRQLRRLIESILLEKPGAGGLSAAGTISGGGEVESLPSFVELNKKSKVKTDPKERAKKLASMASKLKKQRAGKKEYEDFVAGVFAGVDDLEALPKSKSNIDKALVKKFADEVFKGVD
jgi:hypothetical protein